MQNREKQIKEMEKLIDSMENNAYTCDWGEYARADETKIAKVLYDAGYRKQSVGKWVFNKEKDEFFCSVCNAEPLIDPHFIGIDYGIEILSDFCPWCGAKMKGGAE